MNPQRSTFEDTDTIDAKMRMTAFEQVQRLNDLCEGLTTNGLKAGFYYEGNRIPLVNPQRGLSTICQIYLEQLSLLVLHISVSPKDRCVVPLANDH